MSKARPFRESDHDGGNRMLITCRLFCFSRNERLTKLSVIFVSTDLQDSLNRSGTKSLSKEEQDTMVPEEEVRKFIKKR